MVVITTHTAELEGLNRGLSDKRCILVKIHEGVKTLITARSGVCGRSDDPPMAALTALREVRIGHELTHLTDAVAPVLSAPPWRVVGPTSCIKSIDGWGEWSLN